MRIKKPVNLANISSDLGSPGAAIDWDLIDNNSSALSFDADGKAGILNIVTTDGAEGVELSGFLSVDGATTLNGTLDIDSNALLSGGGADGKLILSNLAGSQGVLFDTSTDGQLTLTDESSGDLNLRIDGRIFDGAGPLNLGTAAATGHSLTTGDVIVGGKLEVDSDVWLDGNCRFNGGNIFIEDNREMYWGHDIDFTQEFNSSNNTLELREKVSASQVWYAKPGAQYFYVGSVSQSVKFDASTTDGKLTLTDESDGALNLTISGNRLAVGGENAGYGCINQTVLYSDFVDDGGLSGHLDLDEDIPDGAIVQQVILHTLTGFTGGANTAATITIGDDGGVDADRYNTGTPSVYTSNASGVDLGSPSGDKWHDAAVTPRIVVTTDNDFSTISAGSFKIGIFYFCP